MLTELGDLGKFVGSKMPLDWLKIGFNLDHISANTSNPDIY